MQGCEVHMRCRRTLWTVATILCLLIVPATGQIISTSVQEKANSGDVSAMLRLAQAYETEGRSDPVEAARWYRRAANAGNPLAQTKLAAFYLQGVGVSKDPQEAVQWWRRAASSGYGLAQYKLGLAYLQGEGVAKDDAEGVRWLREAAGNDIPDAEANLGVLYLSGRGVPKSNADALAWTTQAARHGSAFAECNLGAMYQFGDGVEQDAAQAEKWYRRAAGRDFPDGEYRLARFLVDKPAGLPEAITWMRKAASQGDTRAQFSLGLLYSQGRGLPQSYTDAAGWYRRAAEAGYAEAE